MYIYIYIHILYIIYYILYIKLYIIYIILYIPPIYRQYAEPTGTLATMAAFIVTFIDDLDLDVDGALKHGDGEWKF
jgi:hypothetical protein